MEHDLLAVTDEVYEHLVFDGEHVPLATLPGMRDRTVTISSGGKTFSCTGWKVGWVCATAPLVTAVRTAKQFLTYVNAGPFQYGIAAGLGLSNAMFLTLAAELREKRDRLSQGLADAGLTVFPSHGTYFVTTDIRPLGEHDGLAFCRSAARALRRRGDSQRRLLRRPRTLGSRSCGSRSASASTSSTTRWHA